MTLGEAEAVFDMLSSGMSAAAIRADDLELESEDMTASLVV